MELTHGNMVNWFNAYFDTFNKNAGPLETAYNMAKYFDDDLEFWPYNQAPAGNKVEPADKDGLLRTMIHPGLHEELTPQDYIVDLTNMVIVVQFQVQFNDEPSGKVWPAKQASAHYHMILDENQELKIKKIVYFMEQRPVEETKDIKELWGQYRDKALAKGKK